MIYFFYPPMFVNPSLSSLDHSVSNLGSFQSLNVVESLPEHKLEFSPTILQVANPNSPESALKPLNDFQSSKRFSLQKRKTFDEDYKPDCQVTRKNKKSKQMENRNVVPNIIRLVLSYVQKPGKSSKLVEKLLQENSRYTTKRFFLYQKLVKANLDNYVHEDTLAQLVHPRPQHYDVYSAEEQRLYNAITRKLIMHFLERQSRSCVLTSKRMDQEKKQDHIAAIRGLINRLKVIISE